MDLVNEEDLPRREVGQDRGKISAMIDRRSGGEADLHTKFMCNDRSERGLAEARRTMEEQVIGSLSALASRLQQGRE